MEYFVALKKVVLFINLIFVVVKIHQPFVISAGKG